MNLSIKNYTISGLILISYLTFSQNPDDSLFNQGDVVNSLGLQIGMYPTQFGLKRDSRTSIFSKYDFVWKQDNERYVVKKIVRESPKKAHLESYLTDNQGKIISQKYIDIGDFYEGLAEVSLENNCQSCFPERYSYVEINAPFHGYINKNGKEIISLQYRVVSKFQEGVAYVGYWPGRLFYINAKGEDVFKKSFREASPFHNGIAEVKLDNGKANFINKKGDVIIPRQYKYIQPFYEGKIRAFRDLKNKIGFWDKNGMALTLPDYDDFEFNIWNNCNLVRSSDTIGFIDSNTGKQLLPLAFESYVLDKDTDFIWLKRNGSWYRYDTEFSIKASVKAKQVHSLTTTVAKVLINNNWQLYDNTTGKICSLPYLKIGNPDPQNMIIVKTNENKYGYINIKGEEVIPAKYELIAGFSENGTTKATDAYFLYYFNTKGDVLFKYLNRKVINLLIAFCIASLLFVAMIVLYNSLKY